MDTVVRRFCQKAYLLVCILLPVALSACGTPRRHTFCQEIMSYGGVCDDHHLIPEVSSAFRHVIVSNRDGADVYMYMPDLKRVRRVGHTPFTFGFWRETTEHVAYCVGVPLDLSKCVPAMARDMTISCDQTGTAWECYVTPAAAGADLSASHLHP